METISLIKSNQKKLNKKVGKIKDKITTGEVKIEDKVKMEKSNKKADSGRGAVYIGHIPHGFFEEEMRSYFNQFGIVTRVRLARSKKTGNSKGYGFVEFKNAEVAKIVADTMNNYLMFSRLLKCRYIPPEEQHEKMFVRTITPENYPRKKNRERIVENQNKRMTQNKEKKIRNNTLKKIEDFKKFFEERGIEFNFKVNDPLCDTNNEASKSGKGNKLQNGAFNENGNESDTTDTTFDSDYEDETDDQYGVLEIDESDDEIQFKTPPQVKKVIKRSSTSALIPPKSKKLKTNFQSLTELTGKPLFNNERQFSKPVKKNALSKLNELTQSKFPKIQGNLKKWAKSLSNHSQGDTINIGKANGIGQKFQKQNQAKEKAKLTKSLKAKKTPNVNLTTIKKGATLFLNNGFENQKNASSPKLKKEKKSIAEKSVNGLVKSPKKKKEPMKLEAKKKKNKSDDEVKLIGKKNKAEKMASKLSKVPGKTFTVKKTKVPKQSKVISKKVNGKS